MDIEKAKKEVLSIVADKIMKGEMDQREWDTAVAVVSEIVLGNIENAERMLLCDLGWRKAARLLGNANPAGSIYDYKAADEFVKSLPADDPRLDLINLKEMGVE